MKTIKCPDCHTHIGSVDITTQSHGRATTYVHSCPDCGVILEIEVV